MSCHGTDETFEESVRNINNVQQKYTRFLPETSVANNLNRSSLRSKISSMCLTRIMKIMNPSDTYLFKSLWYPLQRSLSLLRLGLTFFEIKSVIFKEASNFVIPHKK